MITLTDNLTLVSVYADLEYSDGYFSFVEFNQEPEQGIEGIYHLSEFTDTNEFEDEKYLNSYINKTLKNKYIQKYDCVGIKFDYFYIKNGETIGSYDNYI